jgi:hypothetical protein
MMCGPCARLETYARSSDLRRARRTSAGPAANILISILWNNRERIMTEGTLSLTHKPNRTVQYLRIFDDFDGSAFATSIAS